MASLQALLICSPNLTSFDGPASVVAELASDGERTAACNLDHADQDEKRDDPQLECGSFDLSRQVRIGDSLLYLRSHENR